MKLIFDHRHDEAPNISTFYFLPEAPVVYRAGQYVQLFLDHPNPDDRGLKRWFTLSSSPKRELLSVTTKLPVKDGSTFTRALQNLEHGDELFMSHPRGSLMLPNTHQTPLLFVAGGMGITPFHSMLTWLEDMGETRSIKLIYAVHTEDDIIYQSMLEKLDRNVHIFVGNPSESWAGRHGRIDAKRIMDTEPLTEDMLIYISGPDGMVTSLSHGFRELGVGSERLIIDRLPRD